MNIQIFGKKKCFDTKKAERYFKERKVKFQTIDLLDKGFSKRELESVIAAVGGVEKLIDDNAKDKDALAVIKYSPDDTKLEKILDNQQVILTPVVRIGKLATVGYVPEIWKNWE